MTERAIRIHRHGGPEELRYEAVAVPAPGPGEALVRHAAIGLNFIDINHRLGRYPLTDFPSVIGMEGAGVVVGIGAGVDTVAVGDRVAYAGYPLGAYATARVLPAGRLVVLPAAIDDRTAAAIMLKGMTAEYLVCRAYPVTAGETVLIHAAAGGVGLIACQWAKARGATVIGTVGSDAKAAVARGHGCDHPIVYTREDFAARVRDITGGAGVPVVFDAVGRDTFEGSLACLRARGVLVTYGVASGKLPPFDLARLNALGSLYVTSASLFTYTQSRQDLLLSANSLFAMVRSGRVRIEINQIYPLADAARAHRDLEGRRTTGCSVLLP
ncbi:MAG: quinone oxidoreductase [Alphaproteobacteria bacterium]|nr:quinone oxidoreductase [Alphaproteobacteria bacterium]